MHVSRRGGVRLNGVRYKTSKDCFDGVFPNRKLRVLKTALGTADVFPLARYCISLHPEKCPFRPSSGIKKGQSHGWRFRQGRCFEAPWRQLRTPVRNCQAVATLACSKVAICSCTALRRAWGLSILWNGVSDPPVPIMTTLPYPRSPPSAD